ncbi:MAG: hypothetical protein QNK03_05695 [Myxococcota bacterium]|nr:hypothetical protein [Myxococcota bacterium]
MRDLNASFYPARQFALFRLLLGAFLFVFFARLVPFAGELFSESGVFPMWPDTPLPNVLRWNESAAFATAWVALLAGLSLLYALGLWRRTCALLLWYGLSSLLARTAGISNPSLGYLGWLLLASALVPLGEPWTLGRRRPAEDWRMPAVLFWGAWAVMAVSYTASGWEKLDSIGWQRGGAFYHVLGLPWARDWFLRDWIVEAPWALIRALTWGALATELLFAPAALWRPTRIAIWCAAVALHLALLATMDFPDISLGMMFIHLWTFDVRWLRRFSAGAG